MALSPEEEAEIKIQLEELRHQHRDLDYLTQVMEEQNPGDIFSIRRMKKRKLELKDQVLRLESMLIPDIIA